MHVRFKFRRPARVAASAALILAVPLVGDSLTAASAAVPYVMPKSEVVELPETSSNGTLYKLYVGFPASYETSGPDRRYPVIYVLDDQWDFPLAQYAADYIRRDGHAPEALVVAIGYGGTNPDVGLKRQWDLTPGNDPVYDAPGTVTGHAQEFLTVIADEIIPFVQANYRVDSSFRALVGNSFGGLFAVYAAFERPNLFKGIVASSPSLDWRDGYVLGRARQFAATGAALNTRFYLGWASGDDEGVMDSSRSFAQEVAALGIPNLRLAAREVEGGGHSGTKPENFTRGLRFVFAPQSWVPTVGIDPGYGEMGKLINLSTRGHVGAGESVLIGGLVVEGVLPKRLLVRGVGPALGPLGVSAPLADPRIRIVDADDVTVASNDDWGDASDAAAVSAAALASGAFALPTGSHDAATVVRLEPGQYTIIVESANGGQGVALVEAYELAP